MRPNPPAGRVSMPGRLPFVLALRRRPRLRRLLALALALAVALAVHGTVRRAEAARAAWGRSRAVVVAARDLPPGHVLEPGDTEVVTLPEPAVPDGALDRVRSGRVVRSGVFEGELLLGRRLADGGRTGVGALLPEDTRAVAIPVDAGAVPPLAVGQTVDVVGVVNVDGAAEAVLLAARAPVVHVGDHAVTVAVAPEVLTRVTAALAAGTVTLALVG